MYDGQALYETKNKVADILLAAELESEMAEMAEGEGDDEQDFEDEMADVCYYCSLSFKSIFLISGIFFSKAQMLNCSES